MLLSNEEKTQNNDEFFTKCQYRENKKKIRNIGTIPTKNIIDRLEIWHAILGYLVLHFPEIPM